MIELPYRVYLYAEGFDIKKRGSWGDGRVPKPYMLNNIRDFFFFFGESSNICEFKKD